MMGATDADRDRLEAAIAANPTAGVLLQGLRGLRTIRFALHGRRKSGGGRAIYWAIAAQQDDLVIMMAAYAKSAQSDLTPEQRRQLLHLMEELADG